MWSHLRKEFLFPSLVLLLIAAGFFLHIDWFYIVSIIVGLGKLILESIEKIRQYTFSLDYIAILAMGTSLVAAQYGAGAVIALMILISESLEEYGCDRAEEALHALVEKIPKTCTVQENGRTYEKPIQDIRDGEIILVRSMELVPLDGFLVSETAILNEANLTGEAQPITLKKSDFIKSGAVNSGALIMLKVSGDFSHSTYQKIIQLVRIGKTHPARLVRLAEKYNYAFTAVTLLLAGGGYLLSHEILRVLAVLVIATPCPLLIAAPVSFIGGLNKSAKKNIIIKKPVTLELLSQATTVFFDKTGTLTLGEPRLHSITVNKKNLSEEELLARVAAIELHSIHPLARAIIFENKQRGLKEEIATDTQEVIGEGISGTVAGVRYTIQKSTYSTNAGIQLDVLEQGVVVGQLLFEDNLKHGVLSLLQEIAQTYHVAILTGDTKANAERLFGESAITIHAHCTPERKFELVKQEQELGHRVVMVGDGLNDAPALALADVGVVFSGTENSAAIEAADVAILRHDISSITDMFVAASGATRTAKQSISWGIGLSIVGMIAAMVGVIPPVAGAMIQEAIDIIVIVNSLRAAR